MGFESVNDINDMLQQLPPEMSALVKGVLMYYDTGTTPETKAEMAGRILDSRLHISSTIGSPFFLICVGICIIIYLLVKIYAEWRATKPPILNTKRYSLLGKQILEYVFNYNEIKIATLRDDINKIYDNFVPKYAITRLFNERKAEILDDRKRYKIESRIKILIYAFLFFFFCMIAICGIYVGLVFKGFVLLFATFFVLKQTYIFVFPCRTDSYPFIQIKEFKKIVENYELEKINDALVNEEQKTAR